MSIGRATIHWRLAYAGALVIGVQVVFLRFCARLSQWPHSFILLLASICSALWQNSELRSLLEVYGAAGDGGRFLGTPQQAYLAGFG